MVIYAPGAQKRTPDLLRSSVVGVFPWNLLTPSFAEREKHFGGQETIMSRFQTPHRPMYFHVERWAARPAWLALSLHNRIDFLDQMGPSLEALYGSGARLVGAVLDDDLAFSPTVRYMAVWAMPRGLEQVRLLERILEAAGWHDYFRLPSDQESTRHRKSLFEYADRRSKRERKGRLSARRN